MVTTRNSLSTNTYSSAQKAVTPASVAEVSFFTTDDVLDSRSDQTSDSDDEYGKRPKKKVKRNRSKRTNASAATLKNFLVVMPLELVFEVLSHLYPQDILHLSRTSRLLRNHLMTRKAKGVWKAARLATEPLWPDCPDDISEPQWADLLCSSTCSICGRKNAEKIIWEFRLRACLRCMKQNFVSRRFAPGQYPWIEDIEIVLQALPWTDAGGWTSKWRRGRARFYLRSSIEEMASIIEDFQTRIDGGATDAQQDLDDFLEKSRVQAQARSDSVPLLRSFEKDRREHAASVSLKMQGDRREAIKARLVALGHDVRDIDRIQMLSDLRTAPLTEQSWRRIRKRCESEVERNKKSRVWKERAPIREARTTLAQQLYSTFKASFEDQALAATILFPFASQIVQCEPFESLIEFEGHDSTRPEDFFDAIASLPVFCRKWSDARKLELLEKLPAGPDWDNLLPDVRLSLATSFFTNSQRAPSQWNTRNRVVFATDGWENLPSHMIPDQEQLDEFSGPKSLDVVTWLIELAGLDPRSATIAEMDESSVRYRCTRTNDYTDYPMFDGALVRSWRNCLTLCPSNEGYPVGCQISNLEPVSEFDAAMSCQLEKLVLQDGGECIGGANSVAFGCNLCVRSMERWDAPAIRAHMKNFHSHPNVTIADFAVDVTLVRDP